MTAATAICCECLGPVPANERGEALDDCPGCGSGYWLPPTATVAELLATRRWAACEDPFEAKSIRLGERTD